VRARRTSSEAAVSKSLDRKWSELRKTASWTLRFIWETDRRLTVLILFTTAFQGVFPAAIAWVARELINVVVDATQGGRSEFADAGIWLAVGFVLAGMSAGVAQVGRYARNLLRDTINIEITSSILTHAAELDLAYFENPHFQDVMERAQQNTGLHVTQFTMHSLSALNALVQILGLLAILAAIEPLVLVGYVPILVVYAIAQWRIARQRFSKEYRRATKRRWTRYFVNLMTRRQNIPEVRIYDLVPLILGRFRTLLIGFFEEDRSLYRSIFRAEVVFSLLYLISYYAVFARVIWRAFVGNLSIGDVAIFGGMVGRLRANLETLITTLTGALEEMLYVSNLVEFLAVRPIATDGSIKLSNLRRPEIEFEGVSFRYPGSEEWVLRDIDLTITAGELVALVGENGAGKTTLAKLLARFYEPASGLVKIDGQDLRDVSLGSLRQNMAFVFQSYGRYEATVAENIGYADWRQLDERMWIVDAAKRARVEDLIGRMAEGYDTRLGRMFGDYDLSSGQWQRLAIARAIARDAAILILDEPTSNLDPRAEFELMQQVRLLAPERTTILISQRFSTIALADRIVVLHAGRIAEAGTHEDLLQLKGRYSRLYDLQQRMSESEHRPLAS
jgi:ATP-binding cassette subfamily B protein